MFQHCCTAVDYALKKQIVLPRPLTLSHFGLAGRVGPFRAPRLRDFKLDTRRSIETTAYAAPELLADRGIEVSGLEIEKVYVWSLGIMLYFLLFCRFPFDAQTGSDLDNSGQGWLEEMTCLIKEAKLELDQATEQLLPDISSLLRQMLDPDPDTRISVDEIMQAPWFRKSIALHIAASKNPLVTQQEAWRPPCEMQSIESTFDQLKSKISNQ